MGGSSRGPQVRSSGDSSNVRHTMYQERPISDSTERLQPPPTTNERFYPDLAYVGYVSAICFLLCGMVLLLAGFVMTVTIDVAQFKLTHQSRDWSGFGAQTVATSVVGPVFLALGTIMVLGGIANVHLQQKGGQQDAEANPRRPRRRPSNPSIPPAAICFLLCGLILLVSGLVMVITKHRLRGLLPTEKSQAVMGPVFLIMGSIMVLGGIANVRTHHQKSSSNDSSARPPVYTGRTTNPSLPTTAHSRHRPRSGSGRHSRRSRPSASQDDPSASAPPVLDSHLTPPATRDSTRVAFAVGAGVVSLASAAAAADSSPPPYDVGPLLIPPSSSNAPPSYDAVVRQQTLPAYDALFTPSPKTLDEAGESNAVGHPDQVLPTYEEATSGLSP